MLAFRIPGSLFVALLLVLMFVLAPTASAGIILSVLPDSQIPVVTGNQIGINVNISGLGAGTAPSLGVYDLDLTFDPTLLSFVNVNWGTGLDIFGLGSLRTVNPSSGLVNIFELSLDSAADLNALQPANFLLASIQFVGTGTGTSNIALAINALGDADGASLPAAVVYGGIASVPEPSNEFLPFSGVLLFWACTWLRHHALKKSQYD